MIQCLYFLVQPITYTMNRFSTKFHSLIFQTWTPDQPLYLNKGMTSTVIMKDYLRTLAQ